MRKSLLVISLMSALSSSSFASVSAVGKAPSSIEPIGTYGVAVKVKDALQSIVPKGWKINIEKGTPLPQSVSWTKSQTWLEVLTEMTETLGTGNQLNAQIDWANQSIYLRTQALADAEAAQSKLLASKAETPLPKFEGLKTEKERLEEEVAALRALREAAPAPVKGESLVTVPVEVAAPEVPMVKSLSTLSSPDFKYSTNVAFNKASLRNLGQAIANTHNVRLLYLANEDLHLKGPITLLGNSVEEDASLLKKALGWYSPVDVVVANGTLLIKGTNDKVVTSIAALTQSKDADIVAKANVSPVVSPTVSDSKATAPAVLASSKAAVPEIAIVSVKEIPAVVSLKIEEGRALESALARFAREQGYTFEWQVKGGYEAKRTRSYEGKDMVEVLSFLPKLGLSVVIISQDKHIIVRPGDAVLDR